MRDCSRTERLRVADEAHAHLLRVQLGDLPIERLDEQPHEAGDLGRGTAPVLAGEREQRERPDPAPRAFLDAHAHRRPPSL